MRPPHTLSIALTLALLAVPAHAQWQVDGNEVVSAYSVYPRAVPDATGGAIVIWNGIASATEDSRLFAQRIDDSGNILWNADGVVVCSEYSSTTDFNVVSDGHGGALVAWRDYRHGLNADKQVFVQRMDAAGNALWAQNGVQVSILAQSGDNGVPCVSATAEGGAIVSFVHGSSTVYARFVDDQGSVIWPSTISLTTRTGLFYGPRAVSDNSDGAIVFWQSSNPQVVVGQRISSDGTLIWGAAGIGMVPESGATCELRALSGDNMNGSLVAWEARLPDHAIPYLTRVGPDGTSVWPSGNVVVCADGSYGGELKVAPDGAGGAFSSWLSYKPVGSVRAQHIDATGLPTLSPAGILISSLSSSATDLRMSEADGSAVVTWRNISGGRGALCVQQLFGDGTMRFDMPYLASFYTLVSTNSDLVRTSDRGHVALWLDGRQGSDMAFCQRVEPDGTWRQPVPAVDEVLDIAGDEGGFLRLVTTRSVYDDYYQQSPYHIVGYNVWRKVSSSLVGSPIVTLDDLTAVNFESPDGHTRYISAADALSLGFPEGNWESLGFHSATQAPTYNFVVSTLRDSTPSAPYSESFVVSAHTVEPAFYTVSNEMSGSSVDNLPPAIPAGLDAAADPNGAVLSWQPNVERDFANYRIYSGATSNFTPDASNFVSAVTSPNYTDGTWLPSQMRFYKVSAVDRHENESGYAEASTPAPIAVLLKSHTVSAAPGQVTLQWELAGDIIDSKYEITRTDRNGTTVVLTDGVVSKGSGLFEYHDVDVIPGGAYRYSVDVSSGGSTITLFESNFIDVPCLLFALEQNSPNPFNPSTRIRFTLPSAQEVLLTVYDVSGRRVTTLVNGTQSAGEHTVQWDGLSDGGVPVATGVYVYELRSQAGVVSRKMTLLK